MQESKITKELRKERNIGSPGRKPRVPKTEKAWLLAEILPRSSAKFVIKPQAGFDMNDNEYL